jgi:sirohydrochlorin ferrochelatase
MVVAWVKHLSEVIEKEVLIAWLEVDAPGLPTVLNTVAKTQTCVVVVPLLLFASGHARVDIPKMVDAFRLDHPQVEVKVLDCLGQKDFLLKSWKQVLGDLKGSGRELWLMGRGTKTCEVKLLYGSAHHALERWWGVPILQVFAGLQRPNLEDQQPYLKQKGLEHKYEEGQKQRLCKEHRPLLLPCLLFDGLLLERMAKTEAFEIGPVLSEIPIFNACVVEHIKDQLSRLNSSSSLNSIS